MVGILARMDSSKSVCDLVKVVHTRRRIRHKGNFVKLSDDNVSKKSKFLSFKKVEQKSTALKMGLLIKFLHRKLTPFLFNSFKLKTNHIIVSFIMQNDPTNFRSKAIIDVNKKREVSRWNSSLRP